MTPHTDTTLALMTFLARVAMDVGAAEHIYVVGGAVRNHLLGVPIKDVDIVVDSIALKGRDSGWFAAEVARALSANTDITVNQYGVAILTIKTSFMWGGVDLKGNVVEIANAREESYAGVGGKGKGYKPTDVRSSTVQADAVRRDFTVNTLLMRLADLLDGPENAAIIDITGRGIADLQARVLRTPLDADRTFTDDPTRLLRLVKFSLKYDFSVSSDLAAAVQRNAPKLADMPWEAVATILVNNILDTPKAREALVTMKKLGLIDVLAEMIRDVKPFAAFMAGQMTLDKDVLLLLDLADLGLGSRAVSFLDAGQQAQLREITVSMPREEATTFLAALKQPPIDNMGLIEGLGLKASERAVLAPAARRLMLADPELAGRPGLLTEKVRLLLTR